MQKSRLLNEIRSFTCLYFFCAKVRRSNRNPLDFIERDFIAGPIIELGGARTFVRGHGLRVLERTARVKSVPPASR